MKNNKNKRGQALIEFALMLPLLFLLVVNVVNFGGFFYAWITVAHAGRSAAQFTVTGPAYAGYGDSGVGLTTLPSNADIIAVLTGPGGDMSSPLINPSKISVTVCTSKATTEAPGPCAMPTGFADPEPTTSVIATADIAYQYCPLIPFWDFPALGIHTTLPPCRTTGGVTTGGVRVHRIAAMRMIQ